MELVTKPCNVYPLLDDAVVFDGGRASAPRARPGSEHGQGPLGKCGCSAEPGLKLREATPEQ